MFFVLFCFFKFSYLLSHTYIHINRRQMKTLLSKRKVFMSQPEKVLSSVVKQHQNKAKG